MTELTNHLFQKHEPLLDEVKVYTKNILTPAAQAYDESGRFPSEFLSYFLEQEVFHLLTTESATDLAALLEIIRLVSTEFASLASILLTQGFYAVSPFYSFGTANQKEKYLEDLLNGRKMGGFGLTEESSGSDLSSLETTAWETEEGWTIQGGKQYVSNASVADVFLIVAKAYKLNGEKGFGLFIVDHSKEGVSITDPVDKMGIKALPVAALELNSVQVSQEALLGGRLDGVKQTEHIMNGMKLSVSMQAIGIAQGSFEKGLHYLGLVRKFGKRLIDNFSTQQTLAEMSTQIHAAEAFTKQVILRNAQATDEVAMVKILTAKVAIETTETMIQLTGGYGYMKDSEIERYVRDAKVTAIYGGSSEAQKKLVAAPWLDNEPMH